MYQIRGTATDCVENYVHIYGQHGTNAMIHNSSYELRYKYLHIENGQVV